MISAVIIDDEQECIDDLYYLIKKKNLPIEVLATANSGNEGLAALLRHKPRLLFLDIVMPGMSGFEMLNLLPKLDFQLIITTSMDKYAIQAIRSSALDFLLKPVKVSELTDAINRISQNLEPTVKSQVHLLEENLNSKNNRIKKIALSITEGIELVYLDDILYFESDGNYTTVHLKGGKTVLVCKPIGKFEELVEESSFYRIHHSFLVNLNKVAKYIRTDGGYILLENGKSITVARSRKDELLKLLTNL